MNKRPALRVDDPGLHTACCGTNTWTATVGSQTVFINGKQAHRMGDQNRHCGGMGQLIEGSPNVIVGELSASGASAGGPSAGAGSGLTGAGAGGGGAGAGGGGAGAGAGANSGSGAAQRASGGRGDTPAAVVASSVPTSFVELTIIDQNDQPYGGLRYRVTASDGAIHDGSLDDRGKARVEGLAPGTCQVSFPDLADDDWGPA